MILRGKAHVFGDDVNTDYIISANTSSRRWTWTSWPAIAWRTSTPTSTQGAAGDFIVAGGNFGCGVLSRPLVIKHAGVSAVLARSFARIFFRNAIRTAAVECDTAGIEAGDELCRPGGGRVRNLTRGSRPR